MATALDLANRSLKLILVEAADSPLEPDEYQDYYDALNDFMADLEARGIRLGFTPVTGPADEITVPAGAIRGIVANMAMEVAPDYGSAINPSLALQASEGMRALRRLGQGPIRASYHPNLPMGTGNDDYPDQVPSHYDEDPRGVLWMTGNATETNIAASGTPVLVRGAWASDGLEVLRSTVSGRVSNPSSQSHMVTFRVAFTATASASVSGKFILMRNGAEEMTTATVALSATRASGTLSRSLTMYPGDFIELWASNETDATDIVVADARIEVD